jgi:hypothetical protein
MNVPVNIVPVCKRCDAGATEETARQHTPAQRSSTMQGLWAGRSGVDVPAVTGLCDFWHKEEVGSAQILRKAT